MWVLIYIRREMLGNPVRLPASYGATYGFFFAAFSVAIMFVILAYFLRFKQVGRSVLDPMQPDAYGMFLVHAAILAVRRRRPCDRQGSSRVRADRHLQLGCDCSVAKDPRRNPGALGAVTAWPAYQEAIGQFTPPDLEEWLRRIQDRLRTVLPGRSFQGRGPGEALTCMPCTRVDLSARSTSHPSRGAATIPVPRRLDRCDG